ncbi:hypothetical protein [Duganella callida]|uniref:Uncharacterized protein n=1 Tax=Duganella callida TaxID=2561932 RepID=A0A4Y9RZS4_9BURK|nr:hypothetical protein [Duganella callida]TFW13276.1 hypothetical protein E4L98_29170 [Duganella callida]
MEMRFESQYSGWDIDISCTPRLWASGDAPRLEKYTATAHASLIDQSESGDLWVDARMQVVSLGSRSFETPAECAHILLEDVHELIDALRKYQLTRR